MPDHIIHKQKVMLRVASQEDTFAVQNRISRLLKDEMPPVIESLLNKFSPDGIILRIDKLNIDLGTISRINLEKEFTDKLIKELTKSLKSIPVEKGDPELREIRKEQSLLESLIFFLTNGYMPWYSTIRDIGAWETGMTRSFTTNDWILLIKELRQEAPGNGYLVPRLIGQFSESFLQSLLLKILEISGNDPSSVYADLEFIWEEINSVPDLSGKDKKVRFWMELLGTVLTKEYEDDLLYELIKRFFSASDTIRITDDNSLIPFERKRIQKIKALDKNILSKEVGGALNKMVLMIRKQSPEIIETKVKQKPVNRKPASDETEWIAENCGMLLLHPFLQMYFAELNLLKENDFMDEESKQRAVLLLHYLATGETKTAEIHLLFPKLLCGMNFNENVPNDIGLTEEEKTESETLLRSVLDHWVPLSGSSIESLQKTFLQREGKLIQTDSGWKLVVEQKTVDVLLKKLAWGISTIQLPWMNNVLNIEWV